MYIKYEIILNASSRLIKMMYVFNTDEVDSISRHETLEQEGIDRFERIHLIKVEGISL